MKHFFLHLFYLSSVFLSLPSLESLSTFLTAILFLSVTAFSLPLHPPTHSFLFSSFSHPHYQLYFNFSPTFSSLQASIDIQTSICVRMCVFFTSLILEPPLLCCPLLVCTSAQLHTNTQVNFLLQYYNVIITN